MTSSNHRTNMQAFVSRLLEQSIDNEEPSVDDTALPPAGDSTLPPADDSTLPPPSDAPLPPVGEESPIAPSPDPEAPISTDPLAEAIREYLDLLRKSHADREALDKALQEMALRDDTASYRTFINANRSAITLLDSTVVLEAQKKIRRGKGKDKSSEELVATMEQEITERKEFNEAIQRIVALGTERGMAWRQLVAVLCGGAVVPGPIGGEVHVPIGNKKQGDVFILRPQAYLGWGAVDLGKVYLTAESPVEYLGSEEQTKISSGAPEERRVLRNRMVIEAIGDQLGGGVFALLAVSQDGSWQTAYFDSDLFRDAYEAGTIIVIEPYPQIGGSLAFDENGNIVNTASWGLALVDKDSGTIDPSTGERKFNALQIAEARGDRLVFTGTSEDLSLIGANVYDHTWSGDPKELEALRSSVPTAREKILGTRS